MISDTLNRKEHALMRAVLSLSGGQERFLVCPYELLSALPKREKYTEESVEKLLSALEIDGYFDFVLSDRKGEKTYLFCMKEAGKGYLRADAQAKRKVYFRLGLAAVGACVTFLVGYLLKIVFS